MGRYLKSKSLGRNRVILVVILQTNRKPTRMDTAAHKFLVTTVATKHTEAMQAVERFLQTLISSGDANTRLASVREALNAASVLQGVLHENYRPSWLGQLLSNLKKYELHHQRDTGVQAAKLVATAIYPEMLAHQWTFTDVLSTGYDFDAIFEDARDSNAIPELFDKIVVCLQQIVDSEAIDSVRMLRELDSLIATLKNSRKGSYVATRHAWFFLVEWMKNTGWEAFGEIPVLGSAVRGLKQTMDNTNTAMIRMHDDVSTQTIASIKTELPRLTYEPPRLPQPEISTDEEEK